jgi:hypothetical protein
LKIDGYGVVEIMFDQEITVPQNYKELINSEILTIQLIDGNLNQIDSDGIKSWEVKKLTS